MASFQSCSVTIPRHFYGHKSTVSLPKAQFSCGLVRWQGRFTHVHIFHILYHFRVRFYFVSQNLASLFVRFHLVYFYLFFPLFFSSQVRFVVFARKFDLRVLFTRIQNFSQCEEKKQQQQQQRVVFDSPVDIPTGSRETKTIRKHRSIPAVAHGLW